MYRSFVPLQRSHLALTTASLCLQRDLNPVFLENLYNGASQKRVKSTQFFFFERQTRESD
jgi:hypothetical protein